MTSSVKKKNANQSARSSRLSFVFSPAFRFQVNTLGISGDLAGRFPYHEVWRQLAMAGEHRFFFEHGLDAFEHDADCVRSHGFHGLPHGSERGGAEGGGGDVIEAGDRTVVGHAQAGLV